MSKFLKLVEENTPGEEMKESLADKFHRFAERVSALEEGRDIDVDELLLELNGLNEELTTLGGIPDVDAEEDYENMATMRSTADEKELKKVQTALQTAQQLKASSNPQRPSRGVKKVEKAENKLAQGVAKTIMRTAQQMR